MEKDKIKVLVLPSWYPPDGGGFFKDHAEALHYEEFEVDVLVNRILGITRHSLYQIFSSRKINENREGPLRVIRSGYLRWPRMGKQNLKGWVNKYMELFEYYRKKHGDPDIIIAHSVIWAGYVAARIKIDTGIPFILVEHRSRFAKDVESAQSMIREWYFPYIRTCLINANSIVTVSPAIDNQLITISPGIKNKLNHIPNLIDTDFFTLPEHPRKKEPFVIISFGILEDVKGFDVLIRSFAQFVKNNKGEFFLRIGGRGDKYRKLKTLAKKFGVADRVTLHGYVPREEVKKEMQMANLFVLPSRFEAFGVVLIEALATGCPVISTYSGGPEYIVNENNGILVEPDNADALTGAIKELYHNYDQYDRRKIREYVVKNYTKEVIRDKYHQLIKNILNEKGTSSE